MEKSLIQLSLSPENLREFFLQHLNMVYFAKSHVAERLPEMADNAYFNDLRFAIEETLEDVEKQIARIEEIFVMLDTTYNFEGYYDLINYAEIAFKNVYIQNDDPQLRDMSILYYLQSMEGFEMTSFQVLLLVATRFKNKQLTQLLKENYDEAKADRALLLLMTTKYLVV